MDPTERTSLTLLERIREGDDEAWNRLVQIYGPLVFQQCRRRGLNDDDACEVSQDVLLAVHKGIADFRRDRPGDRFLHWLRSITSKKIADFFRRIDTQLQAQGGTSAKVLLEQQAEQHVEWEPDKLQRQAYVRAVNIMKTDFQENTWQAFWMTVVEGQTTAGVASSLGVTPGAVRQARSKVRKRLVAELGDLLDISDEPLDHEGMP